MRLLLTSTGLGNEKIRKFFVTLLDQLDNKTLALITAPRSEEMRSFIEMEKGFLTDLGLKVDEQNLALDDIFDEIPEYGIYYVCGGNTFFILDRMRRTRMDRTLVDAASKGKLYVGVSAGSVLAGPDVQVARTPSGDVNEIGLADLAGLRLTPFIVFPHYEPRLQKEAQDFKRYRMQEPVIALTDNQALYVSDSENVLLGEPGGLQFSESYKIKDFTE